MSENDFRHPCENRRIAFLASCLTVGAIMGGLLICYEPVGHDPDRLYRPVKTELAASLRQGTLPFWSDKIGLGVPLVAESHVAAFYPPNWLLYRFLTVSAAYRVSMWLHYVALAAATFAYVRQMGAAPWGAALSAMAFTFCGFQTAHAVHEWAYHALPYLPLCLLAADKFATTGRWKWVGALGLLWGVQMTIGHFQLQMWTGGLVLFAGLWRLWHDGLPLRRVAGLVVGLSLGLGVAMVQLVPSFELARIGGQFRRPVEQFLLSSYPLDHWNELAVPALFRNLPGGPGGAGAQYWNSQQVTGFDFLYVGTIPLVLAILGSMPVAGTNARSRRGTSVWLVLIPLTLVLATMPRWWSAGYVSLLQLPGFGLFRGPARFTVVTSFALCVLAGHGFDRAIDDKRFRTGLAMAGFYAALAFAWSFILARVRPEFRLALDDAAISRRVGLAVITWVAAMILLIIWRRRPRFAWVVFAATAVELGAFYLFAGTTCWATPPRLPEASPVLGLLVKEPEESRVSGPLDDLPVSVGLIAGSPYTGFALPMPNHLLQALHPHNPHSIRWLRRFGVTHLVFDGPLPASDFEEIFHGEDPVLDELAYQTPGVSNRRDWHVFRVRDVFPDARLAMRAREVPDLMGLLAALSSRDALDEAWFFSGDAPPAAGHPRAKTARILQWEGLSGEIEHAGAVDLVLCRASYPGWEVTINNGLPRPALQSNGGLLTARLDGNGTSQVSFRYRPRGMNAAIAASAVSILLCLGLICRTGFQPVRPAGNADYRPS
jgi:hypothetical protein